MTITTKRQDRMILVYVKGMLVGTFQDSTPFLQAYQQATQGNL